MDWLTAAQQLRRDGLPGVLVTVLEVRGHAPRDPGTKMVVAADGSWGSVGGGNLEESAIRRARAMIADGTAGSEMLESKLTARSQNAHGRQCCGGTVRLLLEPLPVWPTVAIFGVGHVGLELARILARLQLRLVLVDSRAEQLDRVRLAEVIDGVAEVSVHHVVLGEQVLERLPADAQVLIMTHDHAEDLALCDMALRLPALGSIGLIGSSAKWAMFRGRLAELGHSAESIDRIDCPIGLPAITGKEPAVIAIGVAAALLPLLQPASVSADRKASSSNRQA
jgi:xanthine dehydrogenase accessory factor